MPENEQRGPDGVEAEDPGSGPTLRQTNLDRGETVRPTLAAKAIAEKETALHAAGGKQAAGDNLSQAETIRGRKPGTKAFGGRYELKRILGRGGMGVVWLALDRELELEVALKFLPEIMAYNEASILELKRETKRALLLTHPHIVRIYTWERDAENAAVSMEYVDGRTLAALKAERETGCLEVTDIREWVWQLCEALEYAHSKAKVVHRDLKPQNLMVNSKGDLKITDFGLSRSVEESVNKTSRGGSGFSGTLGYMSPQQLDGQKGEPTDDLYAMGATIFELLTGKPPFHSGQLDRQIRGVTPPSMAERRRELGVEGGGAIPEVWEQVVASCLAKDPAQRPADARVVWEVLRPTGSGGGAPGHFEAEVKQKPAVRPAQPQPPATSPSTGQATGGARIVTVPAGATVTVGSLSLPSPAVFEGLAPGNHYLKIEMEGYEPITGSLRVEPGAVRDMSEYPLRRCLGTLRVEFAPGRAQYHVRSLHHGDLERRGTTPGKEVLLPTGEYEVCVVHPHLGEATKRVTVHPQKTAVVELSLPHGSVRVASSPSGARILQDGVVIGQTPHVFSELKPGRVRLRLQKEGYQVLEVVGPVVAGQKSRLHGELVPDGVEAKPRRDWPAWVAALLSVLGVAAGVGWILKDALDDNARTRTAGAEAAVRTGDGSPGSGAASSIKSNLLQGTTYENSLGMKFVPVPGTQALFSLWETRVKDYAAYAAANRGVNGQWKSPGFAQGDTHPVVNVSWNDAVAFCRWLTETERKTGRLKKDQEYRLPTDAEWSQAVGIGDRENGRTPAEKRAKLEGVYPWGSQWPPPSRAGNYDGALGVDSFEHTSPVGSFAENAHGLFDLGGNVWEWCQDYYNGQRGARVLRGASWFRYDAVLLLSSNRDSGMPDLRNDYVGFRCVVAVGGNRPRAQGEAAQAPFAEDQRLSEAMRKTRARMLGVDPDYR